jgi:hypothetical protein
MIHHHSYPSVSTLIILVLLASLHVIQSNFISNECLNYCSNGGICLDNNNGPKCICLPEWTGQRCDFRQDFSLTKQMQNSQANMAIVRSNPCNSAPPAFCKNDGICYVNVVKFACFCRYPYIGDNCEELSECFEYCLNNGICRLENNAPKCDCSPAWTGNRCQKLQTTTTVSTPIPSSTTNTPCTFVPQGYCNSGTCIAVNNQARCACPPEFTGNQCEIPGGATVSQTTSTVSSPTIISPTTTSTYVSCAQTPCQNNRPCYNSGNSYYCYCGSQYTGKNCETFTK